MRSRYKIAIVLFACCIGISAGCAGNKELKRKRAVAKAELGNSLIREGQPRAGLKQLIEAVDLDPENADLQEDLGLAYRDLEDYPNSIRHFEKALSLRPEFSEAQNNLGTVYLLLKEWDQAIACFKKAAGNILYETPQYAYYNMGIAYSEKGEYEKVIENYRRAIELSPSFSACYDRLGHAYEAKDRWDDAIDTYKKWIYNFPRYPLAHLRLGKLYLRLGRVEDATRELEQTIELAPGSSDADEARRLLQSVR
ncbi:MAG: tetratricopeptide repeat protein [Pseudomonadota bacterium]